MEAKNLSGDEFVLWMAQRLTYSGHEFLDAARADTIWMKAKDKVLSTTGTLTLEALKVALSFVMKQTVTG
ncbi:MAG: DUF2513 domain-containing protein [Terriglobia bacterium]|nr:DUF2513 domain-containing protein [Terriglobia bacterium]